MKIDLCIDPIFNLLERCQGIEQGEDNHPEKCLFSHSIQTFNWAIRESADIDSIIAALCHDFGKTVQVIDHDIIGSEMLEPYVSTKTLWLIENHIRIRRWLSGDMKKLSKAQELANHPWLPELVQLARWDKMGRNPNYIVNYDRASMMEAIHEIAVRRYTEWKSWFYTDSDNRSSREAG